VRILEGTWPADDLRRAFVEGAQWWEFESTGATMWPSDRDMAEAEAERRFPGGQRPAGDVLLIDLEARSSGGAGA
jgi:hypothetical protein